MMSVLLAIITVTALSGCVAKRDTPTEQPNKSGTDTKKIAFIVPTTFPDEDAKRTFAVKAVMDGHYAEAKALLEQSAQAKPNAETFNFLGTSLYNLGDYDGAIAAWSKAVEFDPSLAGEMNNNVGNAYRDSTRQAEAEKAYRTALRIEPTRWSAAINLADMLKTNGDSQAAIIVLEGASSKNSKVEPLRTLLQAYKSVQ